ncbi:MAG: hypothetical protein HZB38_16070 [Planctomycetes bacterium]|nr:hypothetical protein [Planctomycetota bacterium]
MMRIGTLFVMLTSALLIGGCPSDNGDAGMGAPAVAAIAAGTYAGQQSCTSVLRASAGGGGVPLNQSGAGEISIEIDTSAKTLVVVGTKIEPGVVVGGSTSDLSVSQTIASVDFSAERVTVKYHARIAFTINGESPEFSGEGQYEIVGYDDGTLGYTESSSLSFADAARGFQASVDCESILTKQ